MDYGQPVRFGIFLTPYAAYPQRPLELAMLAEELGYDLVGVQDHPYVRSFFDTWTLLTAVAMRTSRIAVFPDVANVPLRPPAVLAKSAASLDLLTGGRVELGLGAGGAFEAIHSMGGPRLTRGESVDALEEAIQVIRMMWSGEKAVRYEGRHHRLSGVNAGPRPAHGIGIWLGAYKPRMLAMVGRLADGWVPSLGYVQTHELDGMNERIDDAAASAGRDPRRIRRVINTGDAGAEILVSLALEHGMDTFVAGGDEPDQMRRFADEVIPRVREEVAKAR